MIACYFWTHLLCVLWHTGSSEALSSSWKLLFSAKGSPEVAGWGLGLGPERPSVQLLEAREGRQLEGGPAEHATTEAHAAEAGCVCVKWLVGIVTGSGRKHESW